MQHRHLLPNEIDLLLDGDVGFGVAPLQEHVDECASCRVRLADARVVVGAIERLPHFVPSARFADAVMTDVQVIEPLHVALLDAARRWVPQSTPMRVIVGASAVTAATVMTAGAVWLALRADAVAFAYNMITTRVRGLLVGGVSGLVRDAFGRDSAALLPATGSMALLAGGAVGLLVASWAAFGLLSRTVSLRRARR